MDLKEALAWAEWCKDHGDPNDPDEHAFALLAGEIARLTTLLPVEEATP
jgi:hypothetical protein